MDKFIEFAPVIIVVLVFLIQQRLVVTPEQLERKHREIIKEIDEKFRQAEDDATAKYVELNAYKEFQNHIYSELGKANKGIDDLKEFLMKNRS